MGMNIRLVKTNKNTKIIPADGDRYSIVSFKENTSGLGEYALEKDELCISLERTLSYYVFDNILIDPQYISNDNWHEVLSFELKESWKTLKIRFGSVWCFNSHSKEMKIIIDKLSEAKNFYDFAVVMKKYKLELGGM